MHGVVRPIHGARRTDILQAGGEEQSAHDAAQGLLSVGIVVVPPLEAGLGQEAEVDPLVRELPHIQALIGQYFILQRTVFHLVRL